MRMMNIQVVLVLIFFFFFEILIFLLTSKQGSCLFIADKAKKKFKKVRGRFLLFYDVLLLLCIL